MSYFLDIWNIAHEAASVEVDMIELAVALLACSWLIIAWLIKHPQKEGQDGESDRSQKSGWVRIWTLIKEEKYRFGLVVLAAVMFNFGFYAPYKLYQRDQETLSTLTKGSNVLATANEGLTNALFDDVELREAEVRLGKSSKDIPGLWTDCGKRAVDNTEYKIASEFFHNAELYDDPILNVWEARIWPYAAFAVLETNANAQSRNQLPEVALGRFKQSIMYATNKIADAITFQKPSAFRSPAILSSDIPQELQRMRKILSDQHETNTVQFLDEVISTVREFAIDAKSSPP